VVCLVIMGGYVLATRCLMQLYSPSSMLHPYFLPSLQVDSKLTVLTYFDEIV